MGRSQKVDAFFVCEDWWIGTFVKKEKIEEKVDCDFDKLKGINLGFELRFDSVERNTMLLTFSAFVVRILGKVLL